MNHAWGEDRIMTFLKEGRDLYASIYKNDKSIKIPPPRFISCWVSEVCNLDCTYCYFSETNSDKSHQYIDADRFVRWLSQAKAAGAESLEFSGGGEPTLHPQFREIFMRACTMGYKMGIITHACNPMPYLDEMVLRFSYMRCGLDAATVETHDAIKRNKRKGYWFHQAIENIETAVGLRDCLKDPKPFTVGIKVVLNSINQHELIPMIKMAENLRVDYIQIKYEHSSDHSLSPDHLNSLQAMADQQAFNGHTRVMCNLSHQRATVKCFMSPIHTVVTATGKILQCCFFESRPIGTIYQEFPDMWGNEQHRKVIEMTTIEECDKVDCRWNGWNRKMKDIIEDPLASVSFI